MDPSKRTLCEDMTGESGQRQAGMSDLKGMLECFAMAYLEELVYKIKDESTEDMTVEAVHREAARHIDIRLRDVCGRSEDQSVLPELIITDFAGVINMGVLFSMTGELEEFNSVLGPMAYI